MIAAATTKETAITARADETAILLAGFAPDDRRLETLPQHMGRAWRGVEAALRDWVAAAGGRVFKIEGETLFATLPLAAAVGCALRIGHEMATRSWDEVGPIRLRLALHSTSADDAGCNHPAQVLSRAVRLLEAAHPGQVLVAAACAKLLRGYLSAGTRLRDLGELRLRDLTPPEHIYELQSGASTAFPPPLTLDRLPNNLPVQSTALVGREKELMQLCALLTRPNIRLLTLTGPGGTGKTRLSLQAGADMIGHFADGAYFVPLAPISDPRLVANRIAAELGVAEPRQGNLLDALQDYLHDKELLLLLDNFEQVLPAARVVADLLAVAPRLRVLVTSRATLHLEGEHEYAVPPLAVPDTRELPPPERMALYPALALFAARARALDPGFRLDESNAATISAICARLDGLPLAIELAAAQVRHLGPAAILARMDGLLDMGAANSNASKRQRTLRGAVDWSYSLLSPDERRLFCRLGSFVGGWDDDAAAAVTNDLWLDISSASASSDAENGGDACCTTLATCQAALIGHNLIRRHEAPDGATRYMMLETIREYALDQLRDSGEGAATAARHAAYFLALAEEMSRQSTGADQVEALDRLELENDNLRAVLQYFSDSADATNAALLVNALAELWLSRAHFNEGRRAMDDVLAMGSSISPMLRARTLAAAARLARAQGDVTAAGVLLDESIPISRAEGDHLGLAYAFSCRAMVELDRGNLTAGEEAARASYALYDELGDEHGGAYALRYVGWAVGGRDIDAAYAIYERVLALFERFGDKIGIATTNNNMGEIDRAREDYARADEHYNAALRINREIGNDWGVAIALHNLGYVALHRGAFRSAAVNLLRSLSMSSNMGSKQMIGACLSGLAASAVAHDQPALAAHLYGRAITLLETTGSALTTVDYSEQQANMAAARKLLGETAWSEAWAQGLGMSYDALRDMSTQLLLDS